MKTKNNKYRLVTKAVNWFLPFYLFAFLPITASAQDIVDFADDEETIEEDEITVTDQSGNEEVIEFPEAMTYDLDSLLNLYLSKTYLDEDESCNMQNVNPEYSREEYIDRLSRMPTVMEMAYNDVVQKFIDRYSGRLRHSISYMLGACNFYMPIFEEALEAYQIPLELKYLPIIESALNPTAVSRVGATGLWQFMLATARQYNLKVNSLVDERRDPIKASYAAAHLLSDLYKLFGDWNLVIAAYNCGPGNINKAIHRAGGVKDYWQIYPYLPKETRGYVPAFIAANYIMTYYSQHNICPMRTRLPAQSDTVMINRNLHLEQVADVMGYNIEMLRTLNPMYRRDIIPGASEPYALRLPQNDAVRFIDLQDSIYNHRASQLLTNRIEVAVKDDVPSYTNKSKRTVKRSSRARVSKKRTAVRRSQATKRRTAKSSKSRKRRRR
ncbi:MAG: lytic transglycosylase domain-containing protein [Prevotella sp.]|nr:lytic transglycosylase domain-containing protein [Prevotella sp.]